MSRGGRERLSAPDPLDDMSQLERIREVVHDAKRDKQVGRSRYRQYRSQVKVLQAQTARKRAILWRYYRALGRKKRQEKRAQE